MNLRDAFNDLLLLVGYEDADDCPDIVRTRIFADLTAALQKMQACGEDYYGREALAVSLAAGTSQYTLDADVQTVIDCPLLPLRSRAELLDFGPLYLGQTSRTLANGTPTAYFLESLRTPAGAEDNVKLLLHVVPPPNAAAVTAGLRLDVIREAPVFTMEDLCDADVMIPVPHKYVESIFLPLARWNITSCDRFYKQELLPRIESDYQSALVLLGLADPRRPKPPDSNANALRGIGTAPQPEGAPA